MALAPAPDRARHPLLKIPVNVSDPITNPYMETKHANQALHNFTDCPCAFHDRFGLVHRVAVGYKLFLKRVTVSSLFDGKEAIDRSPEFA